MSVQKNKLLEFYQDVLTAFGITVKEDQGLYLTLNGKKSFPFMYKNIQLFLPTKDVIKTSLVPDDNNKLVVVKELFNPLNESADKGDNISLMKLKKYIDDSINNKIASLLEVLLSVLADKDIDINDMLLLDIVTGLNVYKKPNIKQLVDEQTVKCSNSIYKHLMTDVTHKLYTHLYIKNGGSVDNVKYNRVGVVSFPLIEAITKLEKDEPLATVNIRNKDRNTFKVIHEILFDKPINELLKGISFPSKDTNAPAFIAMLTAYDYMAGRINKLVDSLQTLDIDKDGLTSLKCEPFPFKITDLEVIVRSLQQPLKEVPSNVAIQDTAIIHNKNTSNTVLNGMLSNGKNDSVGTKLYASDANDSLFSTTSTVEVNDAAPSALDALLGNKSRRNDSMMVSSNQSIFNGGNNAPNNIFSNQGNPGDIFPSNNNQGNIFTQPTVSVVNNPMF